MLDGADECRKFSGQKPNRGIEEVCEELCRIRELCSGVKGNLNWDKSYISEKDSVFPAQNQLNWCRKEGIPAVSLPGRTLSVLSVSELERNFGKIAKYDR